MTHTKEWYDGWSFPILINGMNPRGYWIDYVEGLKFGFGVDLSKFTYINASQGVRIGDFVEIGQHCSILSHSTIGDRKGKICIGKGTVIGSHTTIMPGVTIGKNCIIGAYSYIDKDIEDGTKYIPNKLIKGRQDEKA